MSALVDPRPPDPPESQPGLHAEVFDAAGAAPIHPRSGGAMLLRRFGGMVAAAGFVAVKFAKLAFIALKSLKFLTTSATMLVSVAAYTLIWGWRFAVGFVALMLVHEVGHMIQLRREGVPTSPIVFIPFLGAAISMA